jgi:uncharacterized protein (TIGR02453 family)
MTSVRHFTPNLFGFLRELAANNQRDWFQQNQERYETAVREPARAFVRDFEPRLEAISPQFRADDRKAGGSLFRIHRDVRFSKDKRPYKTHTGIQFRHAAGRDAHAPGYYLHLEPRSVFVGCGIWHPDSTTLGRIRTRIMEDPDGWTDAISGRAFRRDWTLAGDSLQRAPRGVPAEHPQMEHLRRKDFIAVRQLAQKDITARGFVDRFGDLCEQASPLMRYLCSALELPFDA